VAPAHCPDLRGLLRRVFLRRRNSRASRPRRIQVRITSQSTAPARHACRGARAGRSLAPRRLHRTSL